jgi:hypothetical protein
MYRSRATAGPTLDGNLLWLNTPSCSFSMAAWTWIWPANIAVKRPALRDRLSCWLADGLDGIRGQSYRYQYPPPRRSIR